jgi:hypothetical protein
MSKYRVEFFFLNGGVPCADHEFDRVLVYCGLVDLHAILGFYLYDLLYRSIWSLV